MNISEAKSQLSQLVEEVEAGGEIIIARAGRPVARLVPLQRSGHDRTPGSLRGNPFDRLLIAQARCESLTLVTRDRQLASYDVPVLKA